MARLWITTIGTSLLTNRDDRPWTWNGLHTKHFPDSSQVHQWMAQADAAKISAETNTWRAAGLDRADHVCLLHSDTPEGRYCANRLVHYLRHTVRCQEATCESLTGLGYDATSAGQRGLKDLIHKAVGQVKEAWTRSQPLEPAFCATGGFKSETAFLTLLGALLAIEVYYIHERYREIVCLPRLPLRWDTEWVLKRQQFFEWITEELRSDREVENRLKFDPELQPLVDSEDGYTMLNAAGDLLAEAAQISSGGPLPAISSTPDSAKNGLSKVPHHRPAGWDHYVEQLKQIYCVNRVAYDGRVSGSSGIKVKVLDSAAGTIRINYKGLGLKVDTTAQGVDQTRFIADYIQCCLQI